MEYSVRHPFAHYLRWTWMKESVQHVIKCYVQPELYHWKLAFLMHIPGRTGSFFRRKLLGFKKVGKNVLIEDHVWLQAPENISIGDDCRIHRLCYLDAIGGIEIGSHTGISTGTQIYTANHLYKDKKQLYYYQGYRVAKVVIEEDVWIGAGALVVAGVRIRKGTVVAAGSVVTKDTEGYSVVAGVPAKKIATRE